MTIKNNYDFLQKMKRGLKIMWFQNLKVVKELQNVEKTKAFEKILKISSSKKKRKTKLKVQNMKISKMYKKYVLKIAICKNFTNCKNVKNNVKYKKYL